MSRKWMARWAKRRLHVELTEWGLVRWAALNNRVIKELRVIDPLSMIG